MSSAEDLFLADASHGRKYRFRGVKDDVYSSDTDSESSESGSDGKKQAFEEKNKRNESNVEESTNGHYSDSVTEMRQLNEEIRQEEDDPAYESSGAHSGSEQEEAFEALDPKTRDVIREYYSNPEKAGLDGVERKMVKAVSGPKIEAFNLDEEEDNDDFEEFGGSSRRRREDENGDVEDNPWLLKAKKNDMARAREAERVNEVQLAKAARERQEKAAGTRKWQLFGQLLEFLEPAQTVTELLQELHEKSTRIDKKLKKMHRPASKKARGSIEEDLAELRSERKTLKARISRLTDCAYQLSDRGLKDAFEMPRELFLREYRKDRGEEYRQHDKRRRRRGSQEEENSATPPNEESHYFKDNESKSTKGASWEFKWNLDDDKVYGPYDSETMEAWKTTYFAETTAFARKISEKHEGAFRNVVDIDFSK